MANVKNPFLYLRSIDYMQRYNNRQSVSFEDMSLMLDSVNHRDMETITKMFTEKIESIQEDYGFDFLYQGNKDTFQGMMIDVITSVCNNINMENKENALTNISEQLNIKQF